MVRGNENSRLCLACLVRSLVHLPIKEAEILAKTYYQYYTNVTYFTCAECLVWHGKISTDPASFPNRHDGCERQILAFRRKELAYHREKERGMRHLAEAELRRRELFAAAKEALGVNNGKAKDLFAQAALIDLYIPEIERLVEEKEAVLKEDRTLRARLCKLFARAYSDKFGWPRYERLPEPMRIARERAGIERIKELLA